MVNAALDLSVRVEFSELPVSSADVLNVTALPENTTPGLPTTSAQRQPGEAKGRESQPLEGGFLAISPPIP